MRSAGHSLCAVYPCRMHQLQQAGLLTAEHCLPAAAANFPRVRKGKTEELEICPQEAAFLVQDCAVPVSQLSPWLREAERAPLVVSGGD